MEVGDAILQLRDRSGFWQVDALNMVVEIGLRLDPDGIGEIERRHRQPARENRRKMQPAGEHAPDLGGKILAVARRRLEQVKRADMHRHRRCFQT